MPTRIVLYLNQFFGQLGGEEVADAAPRIVREIVGPGRALAGLLGPDEELVGTVVCGDSYFADHEERATSECLALLRELLPDVLLAGPAFNAGRYGVACGAVCQAAQRELGIPAVTGMFDENPGVDLYRKDVYILRTGHAATAMRNDLAHMLELARKLRAGQPVGNAAEEGYYKRGRIVPDFPQQPAAARMVDMLLAKLGQQPYETEIPLPTFVPPPAPAPLPDLSDKLVALVTDGGLVPRGNPDKLPVSAATTFFAYPIADKDRLDPDDYDVSHGGYDNRYVKADPHRLVPLDVARQLEREGRIGKLYDYFVTTTGLSNPVGNSRRLGQGIAEYLKQNGVEAVILTST